MNDLEAIMAGILTTLNVKWQPQYEVGQRFYPARCHSKYYCSFQESILAEDEDIYCRKGDITLEECRWLQPSAEYPKYILDFAVFVGDAKVCIECDGFNSHFHQKLYDSDRDKYLRSNGWVVKRYAGTTIVSHKSSIKRELREFFQSLIPKNQMELFDARHPG